MVSLLNLCTTCCAFLFLASTVGSDRVFTEEELAEYDGSDPSKPIYLSIKGAVYDVTKGKDFYGKDAAYNALVGRDSTVSIARMSLEPADLALKHDISVLSSSELEALESVITSTYVPKYPVVGRLDVAAAESADSRRTDL
ncbi:neudesin-like [Sycon ciliatum]|uniref:neudesin-like n=1 Tax=Sycon ciliatum TaxID=27933 RepID=UPI0020ABC49A|eukprot:scpid95127/ scgid7708/ Neudesin; Cell immortalization-related protein 2; Neuron-derived neurotrophic factor; Secreted protein of unknown function